MISAILAMTPLELGLVAAGFFLLYKIHFELTVGASRRKMINERGCKPAAVYKHKDPILGLDLIRDVKQRIKNHTILEGAQARFNKYGNTFQANLGGEWSMFFLLPSLSSSYSILI
jgi:hypothetical protein